MEAMLIRRYGGPEVFERGMIPSPVPRTGEVLVRLHGSSVNPLDAAIRAGMLRFFTRLRMPAVLGVDVAGEVIETGGGVGRFSVGERVFAYTGVGAGGGYGELAVVPEAFLARVPDRLDWAEAGTVPGVGASAYEAFTVHAPLQPGMKVFINGVAGGVGTYAVQVAKATEQIRDVIQTVLRPKGVAVLIEATHLCMVIRGVEKQQSQTVTNAMSGVFREDRSVRDAFVRLVERGR